MLYSRNIRALTILLFVLPTLALAQQQPAGMGISPGVIYQPPGNPSCYRITVGNGADMTVDITYTYQNGPTNTIGGWPHLDANGAADICTDDLTEIGQYRFTGVRNTLTPNAPFQPVNAMVTVYAAPQQPTPGSMTFTPVKGYAGNDSYILHFANAANMTIDLDYSLNGVQQPVYTLTVNSNGNWPYALAHNDGQGLYEFRNMRNHLRAEWVATGPTSAVTYLVGPPKPTWLTTTPASVSAGSSWSMTVGNGAQTTLDVIYRYNNGTEQTIHNWPVLTAISNGSFDGAATIPVGACSQTGTLTFTKIKNSLADPNAADAWLTALSNSVTISGSPAPVVTSLLPVAGKAGDVSVPLTITGRNLCILSLTVSPTDSGITFGTIAGTPGGFTASTTFSVAQGTPASIVSVTATTPFGSTTFPFYAASPQPPTVTSIAPDTGFAGTTGVITVTGTNLIGAELSSTWAGLSFKDATYSTSGTSMTAKAVIQATASSGTAPVRVETPSGFTTIPYFLKAFFSSVKEYIRMGERVVAVETLAPTLPPNTTNTTPPTPPGSLTAIAPDPNAIVLQWLPASGTNGASIVQYDIIRDNNSANPPNVPAPALTVTQGPDILPSHTYTYRVVARDNGTPPLASPSNTVTITTPPEHTPPTKPTLTYSNNGENWFTLEWSPSTDAGGSGLAGYRVCFGGDGGSVFDVSGLITDTLFGYEFPPDIYFGGVNSIFVVAEDNAGNVSQPEIWWQR